MKKQLTFLSIALPVLLMLSGCESTSPAKEATAEPVVAAAPTVTQPDVDVSKGEAPKAEAQAVEPKRCDKHHKEAKKHQCNKRASKLKGKKAKECLKHCESSAETGNPKHCEHKDAGSHK